MFLLFAALEKQITNLTSHVDQGVSSPCQEVEKITYTALQTPTKEAARDQNQMQGHFQIVVMVIYISIQLQMSI